MSEPSRLRIALSDAYSLDGPWVVARHESGPRFEPATARGTTLVPTATSDVSRSSTAGDTTDDLDAHGRIYMSFRSAGGRKVASSNLAAPTTRKPAREAGFWHFKPSRDSAAEASWYQVWYQTAARSPSWFGVCWVERRV